MKNLIKLLSMSFMALMLAACSGGDAETEGRTAAFLDSVNFNGGTNVATSDVTILLDLISARQFHRDTEVKSFVQVKHLELASGQQVCGEFLGVPYYCNNGSNEEVQVYTRNGIGQFAQEIWGEVVPGTNGQSSQSKARFTSEEAIAQFIFNFINSKQNQIRNINPNIPLTNHYASYLVAIATGGTFGTSFSGELLGRIYSVEFTDGSVLMFSFNLPLWANPIYVRSASLSGNLAGFSEYYLSQDVTAN